MKPKVSILMRSYNQKKFLIEAIESVLIQDYENLEIVVADDASTDGSQEVLREYEKKYPSLFKLVFNENNLGLSGNFNAGFRLCTGKYIAVLDGDDLFIPGKIIKQVDFMESHPECAIVYHDSQVFESESGKTLRYFNSGPGSNYPYEGGAEAIVQYNWFIIISSIMVRKTASPSGGCDERLLTGQDKLFEIETAMNGTLRFIPEVLCRYRKHEKNVTKSTKPLDMLKDNLMALAIIEGKYPHLAKNCRICRSNYLYFLGTHEIVENHGPEGRKILWESLRQGRVSWKWFGWYLVSFIGIDTVKRARKIVIKT